jgi:hypothetical protein
MFLIKSRETCGYTVWGKSRACRVSLSNIYQEPGFKIVKADIIVPSCTVRKVTVIILRKAGNFNVK